MTIKIYHRPRKTRDIKVQVEHENGDVVWEKQTIEERNMQHGIKGLGERELIEA